MPAGAAVMPVQTSLALAWAAQSAVRLRPYQRAALDAIRARVAAGERRLLVAMATGLGKTVVFAHLPGELALRGRMLVLAHREELLDQAADKLRSCNPGLTVAVEQAERRAGSADVVIASVQSLQRRRLQELDPAEFALVVVDEAHHSVAPTYRRILDHLGAGERCPLIGVTATPTRGDGVGLRAVYSCIAYEMGIREASEQGWLAPICGHRVATGSDLSGVSVRAGEFVTSELAEAVNTERRNALIVRSYRDLVPGRRALAFCVDVEHAQRLSEMFRAAGISAESVCGETPRDERRSILARFASGALSVVTNCNVLTEGYDDPGVSALLMARPTKSPLLFQQMVGRGTRLAPGKADLQVIDFADVSARHSLCSTATLVGLPDGMALKGRKALEVKKELEEIQERFPWVDVAALRSVDDIKLVTTKIEFFKTGTHPDVAAHTTLAWSSQSGGGYRLNLPPSKVKVGGEEVEVKRQRMSVLPTHLDTWVVSYSDERGERRLGEHPTLRDAIKAADETVAAHRHDALKVVSTKAAWREAPASDKQLGLMQKFGLPTPDGLTKGQASTMLDMAFASGRRPRR